MESWQKLHRFLSTGCTIFSTLVSSRACTLITLVTSKMTRCSDPLLFKPLPLATIHLLFRLISQPTFPHPVREECCCLRDGLIFLVTRLGSVILCCAPVFGNALKVSFVPRQCIGCPETADKKCSNYDTLNINRNKFY